MATPFKVDLTFKGQKNDPDVSPLAVMLEGGINTIPVAHIEIVAKDKALDLGTVVGTQIGIVITGEKDETQRFWGTCISAEAHGLTNGRGRYMVEVRPWMWFLTRARNNRIFQNMTTTAIIKEVLADHKLGGDLVLQHEKAEKQRDYCTQYNETDYDFVVRLLEDEGIYFYFDHKDNAAKLVLADQVNSHVAPVAKEAVVFREKGEAGMVGHVWDWAAAERAVTGRVTLRDYDFTKPTADLTATSVIASGTHAHKTYETYHYPGNYDVLAAGEKKAGAMMEADATAHQTWRGTGNILQLSAGKLFTLIDHPQHASNNVFLVKNVRQFLRMQEDQSQWGGSELQRKYAVGLGDKESITVKFEAVSKTKPFRMPSTTPRPVIAGVQTAVVTGAMSDEITVDKYGRIKVRFHWDRSDKKDDKSSCWVRTMMPWTGKNWGMVAFPRVGQEVVIQFEEGNPDRPICVGMLYNTDTMPPYALPSHATRSGIKTNSSAGGGGYNELMFEDKKGDELVRFEAEKDFVQTVQNASHVRVGYDHPSDAVKAEAQAEKSMKLEVHNHLDEFVERGDHSFTVQEGKQTIRIGSHKDEMIKGNSDLTITDNMTTTVETGDKTTTLNSGNLTETIESGNATRTLNAGNDTVNLKAGNYAIKATAGKVDITAAQSITLKVGSSSIKIDPKGVTIKGGMVKIQADMMFEAKGPMSTVKGDATLILKGGVVMIN